MKMYEKLGMSTEDALKWSGSCSSRLCKECLAFGTEIISGLFCPASYLLSDVPEPPKIPRWMTAKTQADFDRLMDIYESNCKITDTGCASCKYKDCQNTYECYHAYLSELVDAPESEV